MAACCVPPLRTAVLGCGAIASLAHLPSLSSNPRVVLRWLVDADPERVRRLAETHGVDRVSTRLEEALDDPQVDAVLVCLPNHLHAEVSIRALEAGKHVFCEKPAATRHEDVLRMQAAALEAGKRLCIGFHNRYDDDVIAVRERIRSGTLGRILHVHCAFREHRSIPGLGGPFTTSAISGGGVLLDWGVHFLDIAFHCTGIGSIRSASGVVSGGIGRDIGRYAYLDMWAGPPVVDGWFDVEDFAAGLVRTDGPPVSFIGAWAQNVADREMHIDFLGDRAGIRLSYGGGYTLFEAEGGILTDTRVRTRKADPRRRMMDAFVEACLAGSGHRCDIGDTLAVSLAVDRLYQSAQQGKEIDLC